MNQNNSILIDNNDNVVTTFKFIEKGMKVRAIGLETEIITTENIINGHKVAIIDIKKGEYIVKYGKNVGVALTDIYVGDLVHIHNIRSNRGKELREEPIHV